jgi:Ca2+-binding RTX toxin-like protein
MAQYIFSGKTAASGVTIDTVAITSNGLGLSGSLLYLIDENGLTSTPQYITVSASTTATDVNLTSVGRVSPEDYSYGIAGTAWRMRNGTGSDLTAALQGYGYGFVNPADKNYDLFTGTDTYVISPVIAGPATHILRIPNQLPIIKAASNLVFTEVVNNDDTGLTNTDNYILLGSPYDDNLVGNGSNDTLLGEDGNDLLEGVGGDDSIDGGNDNDTLDGSLGDDILLGKDGNDRLLGALGNDTLLGGNGEDTLLGGTNSDQLQGDAGDDILTGGTSADSLTGGTGVNRFVQATGDSLARTGGTIGSTFATNQTIIFGNGLDVITDFKSGASGDKLDLIAGANLLPTSALGLSTGSGGLVSGKNYYLSGTYSSGTFIITANGDGPDTLIIQGTGNAFSANASSVLLSGVDSDNLVAANII